MLNALAARITSSLIARKYLQKELFTWYVYVLEKKLVSILGISWLIALGSFLSDVPTTIVFIAGFYLLRSRAGGYHASNFLNCLSLSTLTVVINIYIITPLIIAFSPITPIAISSICFVALELLGTVANPQTQLSEREIVQQSTFMRVITAAQFLVIISLVALEISTIYAAHLSSGMGFVAISSVIGKVKMRR